MNTSEANEQQSTVEGWEVGQEFWNVWITNVSWKERALKTWEEVVEYLASLTTMDQQDLPFEKRELGVTIERCIALKIGTNPKRPVLHYERVEQAHWDKVVADNRKEKAEQRRIERLERKKAELQSELDLLTSKWKN